MTLDNSKKPWESAITEKTVFASGGFVAPLQFLEADSQIILKRFPHKRESSRSGYLKQGVYALIPYMGKFGEGYIIALPRTSSSVRCMYYLNHKQGGGDNGKD